MSDREKCRGMAADNSLGAAQIFSTALSAADAAWLREAAARQSVSPAKLLSELVEKARHEQLVKLARPFDGHGEARTIDQLPQWMRRVPVEPDDPEIWVDVDKRRVNMILGGLCDITAEAWRLHFSLRRAETLALSSRLLKHIDPGSFGNARWFTFLANNRLPVGISVAYQTVPHGSDSEVRGENPIKMGFSDPEGDDGESRRRRPIEMGFSDPEGDDGESRGRRAIKMGFSDPEGDAGESLQGRDFQTIEAGASPFEDPDYCEGAQQTILFIRAERQDVTGGAIRGFRTIAGDRLLKSMAARLAVAAVSLGAANGRHRGGSN